MSGLSLLFSRTVTGGLDYFEYQRRVGADVVIPWLERRTSVAGKVVGDFGCHGGGMLDAFRAVGAASGVGIDLNADIVDAAPFRSDANFHLEVGDLTALGGERTYDLVLLHDVLEHIVDYERVVAAAAVAPDGRLFVSFPSYYSMVGGHQHLAAGPARLSPYIHFLPERLFLRLAQPADNVYMSRDDSLADMLSVRRTKLSLRKAERAFRRVGLALVDAEFFLLRPEYGVRYGTPNLRARGVGRIPGLRELFVNGAFYLLRPAVATR